jgi:hypothetical protein
LPLPFVFAIVGPIPPYHNELFWATQFRTCGPGLLFLNAEVRNDSIGDTMGVFGKSFQGGVSASIGVFDEDTSEDVQKIPFTLIDEKRTMDGLAAIGTSTGF